MDLDTLTDLAAAYNNLGWAIQSQLAGLLRGGPIEDVNPAALQYIKAYLRDARAAGVTGADDLLDEIAGYEDELASMEEAAS